MRRNDSLDNTVVCRDEREYSRVALCQRTPDDYVAATHSQPPIAAPSGAPISSARGRCRKVIGSKTLGQAEHLEGNVLLGRA